MTLIELLYAPANVLMLFAQNHIRTTNTTDRKNFNWNVRLLQDKNLVRGGGRQAIEVHPRCIPFRMTSVVASRTR